MKAIKRAFDSIGFCLFMLAIFPVLVFVWVFGPYLEDPRDEDY